MFVCKKCSKTFDHKSHFDRHKNRKTSCIENSSKSAKQISHKCKKCKKNFSRKDSLTRHLKICKENVNNKNIIGDVNNSKINTINGNNSNMLIKSPISINLIVFTKDGIENITPKELSKMFKSNNNLYESMISLVNFNPNKPQHHNVYYPDIKSSYGVVYENNKWVTKKIDEILNLLLDAKTEDFNEIINEMGDFLNEKTRDKIKDTIKNVDYTKPNYRKKLIAYLKPILYNNKDMIIKTRKMTETFNTYTDDIDEKPVKMKVIKKKTKK